MTMQKVAFAFGTGGTGVKAAGSSKKSDAKAGFDNIINLKASSDNNTNVGAGKGINAVADKNNQTAGNITGTGKVNVINNGSSSVKNDVNVMDSSTMDGFNALNFDVVDGKLQVTLVEQPESSNVFNIDIDGLIDDIRKIVKDILEVSDEEIEDALAENGFVMLDLLNVPQLQEFFVAIEDISEFSDILINDNANQLWTQLLEAVSDIQIEIFDDVFVNAEEFTDIIAQIMNSDEADGNEAIDVNSEAEETAYDTDMKPVIADNRELKADNNAENAELTDNEPKVIINTEAGAAADNNPSDNNSRNQDVITDRTADYTNEEDREDVRTDDVRGSESLFSQFMDRIESNYVQEVSYNTENVQQLREIANQVIEAIRVNVKPDTTGLEIQLNPEHLGKVNVAIEMKEGVAVANFIVRNEMARMALENQMQTLKDTFENQGLKVESVEVTVSDFSFEQSTNEWADRNEGRGENRRRFRSDEEIESSDFVMNQEEDPFAEEGSINIRA